MMEKIITLKLSSQTTLLRLASATLLIAAMGLALGQFFSFKDSQKYFPPGVTIAGVRVGGLDRKDAGDRIFEVFSQPVELRYQNSRIQVLPLALGFQMDIEAMLSEAEQQVSATSPGAAFWKHLWKQKGQDSEISVPLNASIQSDLIHQFLVSEISPRYDQPPTEAVPIAGQSIFEKGQPGYSIDLAKSAQAIQAALESPTQRVAQLVINELPAGLPSMENLEISLKQQISLSSPNTLVEIYLKNLENHQSLHFAVQNSTDISPGIAFTAASTIKIPVMISVLRRTDSPTPERISAMLEEMIMFSENTETDRLMEQVIDPVYGPIYVTEDLETLGLRNTFLGGYFYLGAPLLRLYETPANQRQDINLIPDPYNQTTPNEMGTLLEAIYHCAADGTGLLTQTFPGQITRDECQYMIELLVGDRLPYLITAGLPEGTRIAHKHGWIEEADGLLHTMSDAAIIYSPGEDYVLTIYMYHPEQLVFDNGNRLMAQLSTTIYNFFNVYSNE